MRNMFKDLGIKYNKNNLYGKRKNGPVFFKNTRHGIGSLSREKPSEDNTSIYIDGLPQETTEATLKDVFSKFGNIRKVKLYRNKETSLPKGDALITFMKRGSVQKAIDAMNGMPLNEKNTIVKVSKAVFDATNNSMYGPKLELTPKNSDWASNFDTANLNANLSTEIERRNCEVNNLNFTTYNIGTNGLGFADMQLSFRSDGNLGDGEYLNEECTDFLESLWTESGPILILWNIYSEQQIKSLSERDCQYKKDWSNDPSFDTFLRDLEEDVKEEAQRYGPLKKVVAPRLKEFHGSVLIFFEKEEDCLKCAKRMNGRSFDGNILQVELAGSFLDENLQSNERVLDRDAVETEIEQRENIEQNEKKPRPQSGFRLNIPKNIALNDCCDMLYCAYLYWF